MYPITRLILKRVFLFYILFFSTSYIFAQQSQDILLHTRGLQLPYAKLRVMAPDNSFRDIPFTPLIINHQPIGIQGFKKDIFITGRLVFAGNGIVNPARNYNAYKDINIQGRILVIIYNTPKDFQKRFGEKSDLHIRAYEAEIRGASALVVFGLPDKPGWRSPFVSLPETVPPITIPIIFLSYTEGLTLLKTAGLPADSTEKSIEQLLNKTPVELPLTGQLYVKGNFGRVESEHFSIQYLPGAIYEDKMTENSILYERAYSFVWAFLKPPQVQGQIQKRIIIYFPDYTSLKFYTGISKSDYDTMKTPYTVLPQLQVSNYPIPNEFFHIVLDETYSLLPSSWGISIPVMMDGISALIGQFAVRDSSVDIDALCAQWMQQRRLAPLGRLFNTESYTSTSNRDSLQITTGSFLKYLYTNRANEYLKRLYSEIANTKTPKQRIQLFETIYRKDFTAIQREWIEMLAFQYHISSDIVDNYAIKSEELIREIIKNH
jgi:hypothetical protein